jgi:streptogramin lyase
MLPPRRRDATPALLPALVALVMLLSSIASGASAAGIAANETPLNQAGQAWEVNADAQGTLWVTDQGAKEIRSFDAAGATYTAYQVGGSPSDARGDSSGSVWWADYDTNQLSRLSTTTQQAVTWAIPGSQGLYSTAIDGSGDVWVSGAMDPYVYKLDPDTNQLCMYAIPNAGLAEYLYANGQQLWFGDITNYRIVRLQDGTFDWWNLPADSYPIDVELDGSGRLWWTDLIAGYAGRLDSNAATITIYTPPSASVPQMLALSGGKVWYTQGAPGQVVELNPAVAASTTEPVTTGSQEAAPSCAQLLPSSPVDVATTSGQTAWTAQTYTASLNSGGWTIYDMPEGSAPWGIAASDKLWVVDQGRRVLAQLAPPSGGAVYLPLLVRQ